MGGGRITHSLCAMFSAACVEAEHCCVCRAQEQDLCRATIVIILGIDVMELCTLIERVICAN